MALNKHDPRLAALRAQKIETERALRSALREQHQRARDRSREADRIATAASMLVLELLEKLELGPEYTHRRDPDPQGTQRVQRLRVVLDALIASADPQLISRLQEQDEAGRRERLAAREQRALRRDATVAA